MNTRRVGIEVGKSYDVILGNERTIVTALASPWAENRIAELEAALRNMLDIVEALEPNAITFTEKDEAKAARAILGS